MSTPHYPNTSYIPASAFLVRTPLCSLEEYQTFVTMSEQPERALEQPQVYEAVAIASMNLLDDFARHSAKAKDIAKRNQKLRRYLIRMATRPTPFGGFAGVALGTWADTATLTLASSHGYTRTRVDMGWLLNLIWSLESIPQVRHSTRLMANSAAWIQGGKVCLEQRAPNGLHGAIPAVTLRASRVIETILAAARTPIPYQDLLALVHQIAPTASPEKIEALLTDLWKHTVLLTDLRPSFTHEHPMAYVIARLQTIPCMSEVCMLLQELQEHIDAWDQVAEAPSTSRYCTLFTFGKQQSQAIAQCLKQQQQETEETAQFLQVLRSTDNLFQVDLASVLRGRALPEALGKEIARAAEILLRITPLPRGYHHIEAYRMKFIEKYGEDREIPLLQLLDAHSGLGVPETFTPSLQGTPSSHPEEAQRQATLNQLAMKALQHQEWIVHIDEETIHRLSLHQERQVYDLPPSLDLNVLLAAPSLQAIDEGTYEVILGPNTGGLSGGRNLGRFAPLLGEPANRVLRDLARQEETTAPQHMWAELAYMPREERYANVMVRPLVRSYELVYADSPHGGAAQAIPLDELVVGVRNNRFYVRWVTANKQIRVRSMHMLNSLNAPHLVRLLDEMELDQQPILTGFNWGSLIASVPFLPRIQMGNIIFSPASWYLHPKTLAATTFDQFQAELEEWRQRWQVPRYVYLTEMDNRLLLDLEARAHLEELFADYTHLHDEQTLCLQEMLPRFDQMWLRGPQGHYCCELSVPLLRQPQEQRADTTATEVHLSGTETSAEPHVAIPDTQRWHPLGSEWLFMKFYCGKAWQDEILADPMRTLTGDVLQQHLADDWFFIRYADPEPHIRLRFRGKPQTLLAELLPRLCEWGTQAMAHEVCNRFTFDVYEQEIERYGGRDAIALAEALFGMESRAILSLLAAVQKHPFEAKVLAAFLFNLELEWMGYTLIQRLEWAKQRLVAAHRVHEGSELYRRHKAMMRPVLLQLRPLDSPWAEIFARADSELRAFGTGTQRHLQALLPSTTLSSRCHMLCNRLLGMDSTDEYQVIGLLQRCYQGIAAE